MYLFNSPTKALMTRDAFPPSPILTSPQRCRLSSQKIRAVAVDTMAARREHTFVVSSLSEPVFCPSIPTPFTFQAPYIHDGRLMGDSGFRAIGRGAPVEADHDEFMSDDTSFNIPPTNDISRERQECLTRTSSDRRHDGLLPFSGRADMLQHQHMSLTTLQLRTQYHVQRQASATRATTESPTEWTQIIDGRPQHHEVPRVVWQRNDEASLERQFGQDMHLGAAREWFGVHPDAWPVDHEMRFYDVSSFMLHWASMVDNPGILDHSKHLRTLDRARNVWRAPNVDYQGIDWSLSGVTKDEMIAARQTLYPFHGSTPRRVSKDVGRPMYRFKSFRARHRAQCVHFQLRNILTATSRAQVYYAAGTKVMGANLAFPDVQTEVMNFSNANTTAMPFRITCLASLETAYSHGALVAGGFNGEYALLNLDSEDPSPQHGFVSHAYDGLATHIDTSVHRRSGARQAAYSTNDCHVRVMDLNSLRMTSTFQYNHSVNATSLSPDGRLRLLVGDHHDSMVTDAERGTPLLHLGGHSKDGFACAWSKDGRIAATAAQDGYTTVWDARNWSEPLDVIDRVTSCVRSLHFTADNRIVLAEDDDIVSIYDVSTRDRQNITMFGSIAGVALLDGGNEIVVANSDASMGGLLVLGRESKQGTCSDLVI